MFKSAYRHFENKDYDTARGIFQDLNNDPRYAPGARFFLARMDLSDNTAFDDFLRIDRNLADADSLFRRLPRKVAQRQSRRYALDTAAFADLRDLTQRRLIVYVRVRNTVQALDSLVDGLPEPLPQLQAGYDETRAGIVNAFLNSDDYDVITPIVRRHLAFVRPENYSQSRNLYDRLWPAFLKKYPVCGLDKFARDHPQSFVARDCWREEVRELLCRSDVAELLVFHARNRWTAMESVLLNAISDRTAGFSDGSLLPDSLQQHLADLKTRSLLLAHARAGTMPDTTLMLNLAQDYITGYAPRYSAFRLMEEMLQFFLEKKLYHSGIALLGNARQYFPDTLPEGCATNFDYQRRVQPWIDAKLPILSRPVENLQKTPLDAVNTPEGDEFSPVLAANGSILFFGASGRPDNLEGQDVFMSRYLDGTWTPPAPVPALSGKGNQFPLSVTADGRQMLLSVDGRLHISRRTGNDWSRPDTLRLSGIPLMGKGVFAPDGNAIFLEGAYSTGNVLMGPDVDIFVTFREPGGEWSRPIALGADVNTEGQEGNPFLAPDGRTLYYTSTGYPGLGSSDIFMTRHTGPHWANDWTRALNLGKEVNDTYSHRGFGALTPDAAAAFYTRYDENGGKGDIWMLTLPEVGKVKQ